MKTGICTKCNRERPIYAKGLCKSCYKNKDYIYKPRLAVSSNFKTIIEMKLNGKSFEEIGNTFNVSKQRIYQIWMKNRDQVNIALNNMSKEKLIDNLMSIFYKK
jgi:predicted DNA-binding protein YlxM (UPF0122 family)